MGLLIFLLPVFLPAYSFADTALAPLLSKPLTSQFVPNNPAISSVFLVPQSSALQSNVSGPSPALWVPPLWSFSIGFSGDTFLPPPGTPQALTFTAQLYNGDPIPDWLNFEADTITFGGVTPKLSLDIQVFEVVVIASTPFNATTSDAFTLIVSPHDLSLSGPLLTRNVTANNTFRILLDDWQGVQVDGAPVNMSIPSTSGSTNLSLSLDTSSLPWLSYDPSSCVLSGTPPTSFADAPMAFIPALIKLTLPHITRYLVVSTNLTIVFVPSIFTVPDLPAMSAPLESQITFALTPYLAVSQPSASTDRPRMGHIAISSSHLNFSAEWDPQNTTWLAFDAINLLLKGTVPQDALREVQVIFQAQDRTRGTTSRARLLISTYQDAGGQGRLPTDTLRRTGKRIKLAVGVVFGVAAAVIVLACFLAICRHCCVAREKVDGAYVVEHSVFGREPPPKGSLEKDVCTSSSADVAYGGYLSPCLSQPPTASPRLGHTMTKAAFFNAVRTRFGSDGSWTTKRYPERNRSASSESSQVNADTNSGASRFGSSKRPRKSKISKPMGMVSSSTSIQDVFARPGDGTASIARGKGRGMTVNFTIFGGGNNPQGGTEHENTPGTYGKKNDPPLLRSPRPDISHAVGRILISSPGMVILTSDPSRSHSDPPRRSIHESAGIGDGASNRQSGSASAPSLGTGTRSGTQSTFESGDSTRLTNAAGEIPFRRSGFNGRWETLGERSMRQKGGPFGVGCVDNATSTAVDPDPSLPFPLRSLAKGDQALALPKLAISAITVPPTSNPGNVPPSNTLARSIQSSNSWIKGSPFNPGMDHSISLPSQPPGTLTEPRALILKPGSDCSLDATSSSYHAVSFGDRDIESDSSTDDAENAVITQVVNRSSNETPMTVSAIKTPTKAGRPRLVAFTHERTTPVSGQAPRRDVSQRAVLQGDEESDAEAEMRIGLEYVRRLGDPDDQLSDVSRPKGGTNEPYLTSHVSFVSNTTPTPQAEFYASNDTNNSIAGRTRVLAPLLINSHRNRHQAIHSMEGTHDSFLSLVDRDGEPHETRWMVESTLPRFTFNAKEPFNFAVPLESEHKRASVLAGSALEAKQSDGTPLPEWLRFDKGGKEFWGVTPKAMKGEKGEMLVTRVIVKIWDGEKDQVVGGCVVDVLGDRE